MAAEAAKVGPGVARSAGWPSEADGDVKEFMPIAHYCKLSVIFLKKI
jgi:hypothetical protein